ncbi:hypothetical protein AMC75_00980 [Staphylococcus carnosus]|uniref:Prepilin peptidase A24 N-terminal domain-containing protein n=2 Tax=Staphylococcus carnosus TaxID=1281 RepID=A0AAJ0JQD1_STACA|nr:hypothetical protein BEK99_05035 [Staphylococcus carnosus]KKB26089.1 hypothetical protein VV61_00975 [Staphylococcus carnosus]KOR13472.1 hypothetical protein AMC75_00980 [Staphylococcus carnosus]UTB80524.1 hypothetical protein A2I65_06415 [Staphylococcus carnosus]UTB83009.1 hypothetical protein A2I67_06655 [Staphylococcus carnosus]
MSIIFSGVLCVILESFLLQFCHVNRLDFTYLKRRSRCEKCNHTLQFLDLIPIISFIFLKGKCRYCNENIPFIHFAGELVAWLPVILLYNHLLGMNSNLFLAFYLLLLTAALYDIQTFSIPLHFLLIMYIVIIVLSEHIFINQIGLIILLHLLFFFSKSSIGYGDIAVFSLFVLVTPYQFFFLLFCITFIVAGVFSLFIMYIWRKKIFKIPLVPYIFLSFLFVSVFYPFLVRYFYL